VPSCLLQASLRGRNWKQRDLAQHLLLFHSLPVVKTIVTCKRKKNASKVSVLPPSFKSALFWFLSFSWIVDFSSTGNKSAAAVFCGRYWVVVNGRIYGAEGAGEPVDGAAVVDGMDNTAVLRVCFSRGRSAGR